MACVSSNSISISSAVPAFVALSSALSSASNPQGSNGSNGLIELGTVCPNSQSLFALPDGCRLTSLRSVIQVDAWNDALGQLALRLQSGEITPMMIRDEMVRRLRPLSPLFEAIPSAFLAGGFVESIFARSVLTLLRIPFSDPGDRMQTIERVLEAEKSKEKIGEKSEEKIEKDGPKDQRVLTSGDIDIYLGSNRSDDVMKVVELFSPDKMNRTEFALSFYSEYGYYSGRIRGFDTLGVKSKWGVQVLLHKTPSMEAVLRSYDLGSVQIAYQSGKVYLTELGLSALFTGVNRFDLSMVNRVYGHRVAKYLVRGYDLLLPLPRAELLRKIDPICLGLKRGLGELLSIDLSHLASPSGSYYDFSVGRLRTCRENGIDMNGIRAKYEGLGVKKFQTSYIVNAAIDARLAEKDLLTRIYTDTQSRVVVEGRYPENLFQTIREWLSIPLDRGVRELEAYHLISIPQRIKIETIDDLMKAFDPLRSIRLSPPFSHSIEEIAEKAKPTSTISLSEWLCLTSSASSGHFVSASGKTDMLTHTYALRALAILSTCDGYWKCPFHRVATLVMRSLVAGVLLPPPLEGLDGLEEWVPILYNALIRD